MITSALDGYLCLASLGFYSKFKKATSITFPRVSLMRDNEDVRASNPLCTETEVCRFPENDLLPFP